MNKSIDDTLDDRGSRYGDFQGHADITQHLKRVMSATPNWPALADDQKEALDMVANKIGRILNGDPDYLDSWHDIIGYVRLVEQRLERRGTPPWPESSAEDDEAFEREFDEVMHRNMTTQPYNPHGPLHPFSGSTDEAVKRSVERHNR